MRGQAAILVVQSRALFARLTERLSPARHSLQFAATTAEARGSYYKHHPWLIIVPVSAVRTDLLSLLREARAHDAVILGLTAGEKREVPNWADRVVPQDDLDVAVEATSSLIVARRRAPKEEDRTPVFEVREPPADIDTTVVDRLAEHPPFEVELDEATRREVPADLLLAFQGDEADTDDATRVDAAKEAPSKWLAALIVGHRKLREQLEALAGQHQLVVQRLDVVDHYADQTRALEEIQTALAQQAAQARELEALRASLAQQVEPEADALRAALTQQAEQAHEVEALRAALAHQSEETNQLARQLGLIEEARTPLQGLIDQQLGLLSTLSQRLDYFDEDKAPAKDLAQTRQALERLRAELAQAQQQLQQLQQAQQQLQQAQQQLGEQLDQASRASVEHRHQAEQQSHVPAGLEQQLELTRMRLGELDEAQQARIAVEDQIRGAQEQLFQQLREAREIGTAARAELDEQTRMFNGLNRRLNRLHLDVKDGLDQARKELQQLAQEQQVTVALQQTAEAQSRELAGLDERLAALGRDKAPVEELARAREALEQLAERLRLLGQELAQHVAHSERVRTEQLEKADEQAGRVIALDRHLAVLTRDKAQANELAQARRELVLAQSQLEQHLERAEAELRQHIEQAGGLPGKLDEHAGQLIRLAQRLDALVEDKAAASALEQTRGELEQGLQRAREDLAQQQASLREQLDERVRLAREELVAQQSIARDQLQQRLEVVRAELGQARDELSAQTELRTRDELQARTELRERTGQLAQQLETLAEEKAPARRLEEMRTELERADQQLLFHLQLAQETLDQQQSMVRTQLEQENQATRDELGRQQIAAREQLEQIRQELGEQIGQTRAELLGKAEHQERSAAELELRLGTIAEEKAEATRLEETRAELERADQQLVLQLQHTREELGQQQIDARDQLEEKIGLARDELGRQQTDARDQIEQKIEHTRDELGQQQADTRAQLEQKIGLARDELGQQLEQARAELRARAEQHETNAGELAHRLGTIAEEKADGQRLEETRAELERTDQRLEQALRLAQEELGRQQAASRDQLEQKVGFAREELGQQLERATRATAELQQRIEAELATVAQRLATLAEEKAAARQLEETRAELERADQQLLLQLQLVRDELGQQQTTTREQLEQQLLLVRDELERARAQHQARVELQEKIDAEVAQRLATIAEEKAQALLLEETRAELRHTTQRLEQKLQLVRDELGQQQTTTREQLEQSLQLTRDELGAARAQHQARVELQEKIDAEVAQRLEAIAEDKAGRRVFEETRDELQRTDHQLERRLQLAREELGQQQAATGERLDQRLDQQQAHLGELDQALEVSRAELGQRLETRRAELQARIEVQEKIEGELGLRLVALTTDKAAAQDLEATRAKLERLGQQMDQAQQARTQLQERLDEQAKYLFAVEQRLEDKATARELEAHRAEAERKLQLVEEKLAQQLSQGHQAAAEQASSLDQRLSQTAHDVAQAHVETSTAIGDLRARTETQSRDIAGTRERLERLLAEARPGPIKQLLTPPGIVAVLGLLLSAGVTLFLMLRTAPVDPRGSAHGPSVVQPVPRKTVTAPPSKKAAAASARRPDAGPASRAATALPAAAKPALSPAERQTRDRRIRNARRLITRGKQQQAQALLALALQAEDDFQVRQLLATSHEKAREFKKAAEHLEKAVPMAPRALKPKVYDSLGLLYVKDKDRAHGCTAFRQAARLKPKDKGFTYHVNTFCKGR